MENPIAATISDFNTTDLHLKGFKTYMINTKADPVPHYGRRDFYKICLVTGKQVLNFADRSIEVDGSFLFFGNPHVPYSSRLISEVTTGYACLFSDEFLKVNERSGSLQESPLFQLGGSPVVQVNDQQWAFLSTFFEKMLAEQQSDYIFKDDLVRSYLHLIIQEALKMTPLDHLFTPKNASSRIAFMFLELLERQFPVENIKEPVKLRTAQDFAGHLSVHVNYLNRSVKEVTGKPTTVHIAERITTEAKALLQYTDWSVAEIAYSLGFEYVSYFNNYFKKITGAIPKAFRGKALAPSYI
jgi:AraC family transcriptional activator of pobA